MSILSFITQDEIYDLDEDPRIAFADLVNTAQKNLRSQISDNDTGNDEADWERCEELRHRFMNAVIAAAKRFEIEPFASMIVPKFSQFRKSVDHRDFQADLDHYITQLTLDNIFRAKRDSVKILPTSKDRIRTYVHELRRCVEQSNMTEAKQDALLNILDKFIEELEKRRMSLLAVTRFSLELMAIPGGLWASYEVTNKLITNIMHIVAEAKAAENETRQLAPPTQIKALSPPRIEAVSSDHQAETIIDDNIPF